jgi:hypothetical protein
MTDSLNFGIVSSHNVMIPMRDGVRLATDIYRPADELGNAIDRQFPVIVGRTSYDKSNPVIWIEAVANAFVPRGYVVVAEIRKEPATTSTPRTRRKASMATTRSSGLQVSHGRTEK